MSNGSIILFSAISILILIAIWLVSYFHRTRDKKLPIGAVSLIVLSLFVIFGNYHLVPDTNKLLVERPYFGFSDTIGSVNACTDVPYFVAVSKHASLCKALQKAGYLESDEEREQRIKKEVEEEISNVFEDTDRVSTVSSEENKEESELNSPLPEEDYSRQNPESTPE